MVKQPKLQQSSEIDRITQKLISQVGEQITNPSDNPGQGHREKLDKMTKKLSTFFGAGLACWLAEGREVQGQEKNLPAGWIPGGGGLRLERRLPHLNEDGERLKSFKSHLVFFRHFGFRSANNPSKYGPLIGRKKGKKTIQQKKGGISF